MLSFVFSSMIYRLSRDLSHGQNGIPESRIEITMMKSNSKSQPVTKEKSKIGSASKTEAVLCTIQLQIVGTFYVHGSFPLKLVSDARIGIEVPTVLKCLTG